MVVEGAPNNPPEDAGKPVLGAVNPTDGAGVEKVLGAESPVVALGVEPKNDVSAAGAGVPKVNELVVFEGAAGVAADCPNDPVDD